MPEPDGPALANFLTRRGLLTAPVELTRIGDGHSNISYLAAERGAGRRVVVRRPPAGRGAAYDVLREARTIAAVGSAGFPAPRVFATAEAGEVLDVPLFVMDFVPGPIVTTQLPPELGSGAARRAAAESLVDTLAALHALDWTALGLRGRPDGANRRQRGRFARLVADAAGEPPASFRVLDEWLEAHTPPESAASVVHSDYRLGNVVLDPETTRVRAVLDWELAAVGDPLVDVGYLLATWAEPGRALTPIEELGRATAAPGFPSRRELAERYAVASGRDLDGIAWYVALAYWRLAVLYEYNRRLAEAGDGDPYYAGPEKVEALLAAGEQVRAGL